MKGILGLLGEFRLLLGLVVVFLVVVVVRFWFRLSG